MSSFTEEPIFSFSSEKRIKNCKPFSFYCEDKGGEELDIAEGYECDGGTIQRFA